MSLRFSTLINRALNRMGYSSIKRRPSPQKLYDHLAEQPLPVIQYELKRISSALRQFNDHRYYNQILQKFVPSWTPPTEKISFIGKGYGVHSLNLYRKLEDPLLFEKVYFTNTSDLENHQWALSHLVPHPNFTFSAPAIQSINKGDLLTIVYFTYVKLKKLPDNQLPSQLVQISKELYEISSSFLQKENSPQLQKPYRETHRAIATMAQAAKARLQKQNINTDFLDWSLENSKFILAHGDLTENNAYSNNIIIDWDYFGLYPIGYDVWKIYIRLKRKDLSVEPIQTWLEKWYQPFIANEDWEDFNRNVLYLLYLNGHQKYQKWGFFSQLEQEIMEGLKRK